MTTVVTLMAAGLDHELRARFNFCLSRETCEEIMSAVIGATAAIAQGLESSHPARPHGRVPDGGCTPPSDAFAVAFSSSADLAPPRTSDGGRAPSGDTPAVTLDHATTQSALGSVIRAGDIVHHEPSGEDWVVAYVDGEYLAWCGWPAGEAKVSDCRLMKSCSEEEHVDWLRQIAKADGKRGRHAQMALAALTPPADRAEGAGMP